MVGIIAYVFLNFTCYIIVFGFFELWV